MQYKTKWANIDVRIHNSYKQRIKMLMLIPEKLIGFYITLETLWIAQFIIG